MKTKKCKSCNGSKIKWIGHGHKRHRIPCPDCHKESRAPVHSVFCARSGTWRKPMRHKNDRHYYSGCER